MATTNGIMQMVQDGKVVDTSASGNSPSKASKNSSSLDKEAFLQLLVAQMKYQDPLEPTSNTEYISQLATFSSLEEMQNMNATMTNLQGTNLVGKQVVMSVTSEVTGTTTEIAGFVEYVTRENNKTYLVIEGQPYNIDDLESVIDDAYLEAVALAETFKETMASLPSSKYVTLNDKDRVNAVYRAVNAMTSYQQGFLDADSVTKLKELIDQLAVLEKEAGKTEGKEEGTEGTEQTENNENSGGEGNE